MQIRHWWIGLWLNELPEAEHWKSNCHNKSQNTFCDGESQLAARSQHGECLTWGCLMIHWLAIVGFMTCCNIGVLEYHVAHTPILSLYWCGLANMCSSSLSCLYVYITSETLRGGLLQFVVTIQVSSSSHLCQVDTRHSRFFSRILSTGHSTQERNFSEQVWADWLMIVGKNTLQKSYWARDPSQSRLSHCLTCKANSYKHVHYSGLATCKYLCIKYGSNKH